MLLRVSLSTDQWYASRCFYIHNQEIQVKQCWLLKRRNVVKVSWFYFYTVLLCGKLEPLSVWSRNPFERTIRWDFIAFKPCKATRQPPPQFRAKSQTWLLSLLLGYREVQHFGKREFKILVRPPLARRELILIHRAKLHCVACRIIKELLYRKRLRYRAHYTNSLILNKVSVSSAQACEAFSAWLQKRQACDRSRFSPSVARTRNPCLQIHSVKWIY